MTDLYQLFVCMSRKHIATVNRRSYGGQQNDTIVMLVAMSIDLKHTELIHCAYKLLRYLDLQI